MDTNYKKDHIVSLFREATQPPTTPQAPLRRSIYAHGGQFRRTPPIPLPTHQVTAPMDTISRRRLVGQVLARARLVGIDRVLSDYLQASFGARLLKDLADGELHSVHRVIQRLPIAV